MHDSWNSLIKSAVNVIGSTSASHRQTKTEDYGWCELIRFTTNVRLLKANPLTRCQTEFPGNAYSQFFCPCVSRWNWSEIVSSTAGFWRFRLKRYLASSNTWHRRRQFDPKNLVAVWFDLAINILRVLQEVDNFYAKNILKNMHKFIILTWPDKGLGIIISQRKGLYKQNDQTIRRQVQAHFENEGEWDKKPSVKKLVYKTVRWLKPDGMISSTMFERTRLVGSTIALH